MVCIVPNIYIESYCNLYKRIDEYYDKGYVFNYEELTYTHFKENIFFKDTILLDKKDFEWGYFRNERIERM